MNNEKELIQLILDTNVLDIDSKKEIIIEILKAVKKDTYYPYFPNYPYYPYCEPAQHMDPSWTITTAGTNVNKTDGGFN